MSVSDGHIGYYWHTSMFVELLYGSFVKSSGRDVELLSGAGDVVYTEMLVCQMSGNHFTIRSLVNLGTWTVTMGHLGMRKLSVH